MFSWKLDGKPKAADDSAFVTILSGTHTRAVDALGLRMENYGSGTFIVDWDVAQTLPEHDQAVGVATFTYSRAGPGGGDDDRRRLQGHPGRRHGGHRPLRRHLPLHGDAGRGRRASLRARTATTSPTRTRRTRRRRRSRFTAAGWRRAPAAPTTSCRAATSRRRSTGTATVSECWDVSFASQYQEVSYDPTDPTETGARRRAALSTTRSSSARALRADNLEAPGAGGARGCTRKMSQPSLQLIDGGQPADSRAALRELYTKYGGTVYGRCQYLLGDRTKAEDAMQDVFAKALSHWHEFRTEASPLTWLIRIATHHCLNLLRAERAPWHRGSSARSARAARGTAGRSCSRIARRCASCWRGWTSRRSRRLIHYFVDEMTLDEVAAAIGRSVPTVRKRLSSVATLRETVQHEQLKVTHESGKRTHRRADAAPASRGRSAGRGGARHRGARDRVRGLPRAHPRARRRAAPVRGRRSPSSASRRASSGRRAARGRRGAVDARRASWMAPVLAVAAGGRAAG